MIKYQYEVHIHHDLEKIPSPQIIHAEKAGVTEEGHLVFQEGDQFVAGFADGYWISFKGIGAQNELIGEGEEIVAETVVEEAIEEPVIEEPIVKQELEELPIEED